MRSWPLILTLSLALSCPLCSVHARGPGAGSGAPCRPRCEDPKCLAAAGRCLLEANETRQARDLLKGATARFQGNAELHLLLARAYWELGTKVWARRVLYMVQTRRPDDCLIRSWLIWLHLKQAELEQAEDLLEQQGCPRPGPMKGRWELLRATLARHGRDREEAARRVEQVLGMEALFEEDQDLLDQLTTYALPRRQPPLRLRVEVGTGDTSNGLMSNPAAVASLGQDADTGSPALSMDAQALFNPPWGRRVRPILELGLRSLILLDTAPVSPHSQVTRLTTASST